MCQAAIEVMEVDGAALTAVDETEGRVTLAGSGRLSRWVTELELTTGQGPCWDAHTEHRSVSDPDLSNPASQQRWPGFAAAAVEAGVWAVFAFPLLVGTDCAGTLLLYRHRRGLLTPVQLRDGLRFADDGLWALLDTRAGLPDGAPPPALGDGQDEVNQAAGMISVQLRAGVDEALIRLRAHAWAHDQTLTETAADVIARRLRFTPEPNPGTHGEAT